MVVVHIEEPEEGGDENDQEENGQEEKEVNVVEPTTESDSVLEKKEQETFNFQSKVQQALLQGSKLA